MHFSVFLPNQFVKALSVFFIYKNNRFAFPVRTSDAQETQSSCRGQGNVRLVLKTPPFMQSEGSLHINNSLLLSYS
jgi:hypothetical protein